MAFTLPFSITKKNEEKKLEATPPAYLTIYLT